MQFFLLHFCGPAISSTANYDQILSGELSASPFKCSVAISVDPDQTAPLGAV